MESLEIDDFYEILSTIRLAKRFEERQLNRSLASLSYAIWFSEVPPKKRKSYNWYLRQLNLDDDPERHFLGPYPDEDEEDEKQGVPQAMQGDPTDAEIEAFLESGGNEWGRITMVHLQEYKARRASKEAGQ